MPDDVPNTANGEEKKKNNNGRNSQRGQGGNVNARGRGGKKPQTSRAPQRPQATKVDMKKYERMITAAHTNFSDIPCGPKAMDCDICCKPNDVFGIGPCRHPVCVECAIRMRVLGDTKTCPVCRADVDTLSFVTLEQDPSTVNLEFPLVGHEDEKRHGVRFGNATAGKKYEKYLAHVCKICKAPDGERLEFPTFMSLRQHMAHQHDQTYCHICTDNLSLFSRERKTYGREQLQRHMKTGDFDDKSFKGHPQCLFCELKFLDEENRYRHLRKEHFFCQFCESDGTMTNVFFGKHDELKRHYKENHYICETEECKAMGIAFANKFELDLHRANEHSEKRNLIELGFGQRPQPADAGRPMGRGRGGRHNDPAPPVPRERIALVQRQVETNPQSDPSQFTTVRSAQSKSTFIVNRSAYAATSQQDFPSLAGSAPPPPPIRSSEFPRLNKVNKPATPAASTPAPSEPVEHFPSLGDSAAPPLLRIKVPPLAKKRQPPPPSQPQQQQQKNKPSRAQPTRSREDDDEEFISSRRDVPQAVIKVNNTKLRFDTVDDRVTPTAKSNIQMIKREDSRPTSSGTSSAAPAGRMDFPALPAASAPMIPANSSWLNSKNNSKLKSGVISSVTVPRNYSKATQQQGKKKTKVSVPKTEVWSSLGPAPEVFTPATPTDEWQDIPLSKEAQAEKEKLERKEEWARKKAEIQARVAAASKKTEEEEVQEEVEDVPEPVVEKTWKQQDEEDWKEVTTKAGELARALEEKKKNNKKNKKKEQPVSVPVQAPVSAPVPGKPEPTKVAAKPDPKPEKKIKVEPVKPKPLETKPAAQEAPKDSYQEKMDALWSMPKLPSVSSMFSSFSLSSMFGGGGATTPATPETISGGPPPGLESVVPTPPPGLGRATDDVSFASAPMLSHDDVKEKRERIEAEKKKQEIVVEKEDDGWTTTGKAAMNQGKKNKNKK